MHAKIKATDFNYGAHDDEATLVFRIDSAYIAGVANPLAEPPWAGMNSPITREEVLQSVLDGNVASEPVGAAEQLGLDDPQTARKLHVGRIAWFVSNPSTDPIWIEVGVPELGEGLPVDFLIGDGNHRLAASIIRSEPIRASFSGSWDRFVELFPDAVFDGILENGQADHPMFC